MKAAPRLLAAALAAVSGVLAARALSASSPRAPFFSESALQYAYARRVAEGGSIPELDRAAQWPEGLRPRRELTLLSEEAVGGLYRLWPESRRPSFPDWVARFWGTCRALSVLAVFLIGEALAGAWAALAAAGLFAFSTAGILRAAGGFEHETFALPLLLLSLGCLARGTSSRRGAAWGLASGVLLAAGLFAWHVSRFWWAGLAAAFGLSGFLLDAFDRRLAAAPWLASTGAAVGLCLLFGRRYAGADLAGSPQALVSAALALAFSWPVGGSRRRGLAAASALLLAVCVAARLLGPRSDVDFGHVSALLLQKMRHLGRKPLDPSRLPLDARLLWVEDFDGATARQWLYLFGPLLALELAALLAGAARVLRLAWRATSGVEPASAFGPAPAEALLLPLAFGSVLAACLTSRLLAVPAALLPAFAAVALREAWSGARRPWPRVALALLAAWGAALSAQELAFAARFGTGLQRAALASDRRGGVPGTPPVADAEAVADWIETRTPTDAVILAHFPLSAALYARGRAVNLQPKFEHREARLKFSAFLEALYGSEDDLRRLCGRWGATYVVYQADMLTDEGTDGIRAMAGVRRVPPGSAAALMLRRPDALKGFGLVYARGPFRVFKTRA